MMSLKIIRVEFENLKQFENGMFCVDFFATDRVLKSSEMLKLSSNLALQNIIGFIGLNATGKTTALRLLKTVLNIVIWNADLNDAIESALIDDGTTIRITFLFGNEYYQLESIVGRRSDNKRFYYKNESLKRKTTLKFYSRADLIDFADVPAEPRPKTGSDAAKYLEDSKSFIGPITRENNGYIAGNLWRSYVNSADFFGDTPPEILEVFDESIEEFSMGKPSSASEPIKWTLKFKTDNNAYIGVDMLEPNLLVSTGTISGRRLIRDAIEVLKHGGYLFVDELEAHLNKEIVRFVLSLFSSQKTNPHGACLIFSTHYAEILDFGVLNRKDNIYITRKKNYLLSVRKFSDDFKRNDFKKSEIILSNALKGTAPKYESMERLREYVCNQVR